MNETTFLQAVIPTISLFHIEELVNDKLDGFIHFLKARSATESSLPQNEELPNIAWITLKTYETPFMFINYSFDKMPEAHFSLPLAIEVARRKDINVHELWVDSIDFFIDDNKYGRITYKFKNKPITKGSDAEAFVYNFYKKAKFLNRIKRIPRRHLVLYDAQLVGRKGAHLDWHITHGSKFLAWLNRTLHGIVYKKEIKQMSENVFVDLNITPT